MNVFSEILSQFTWRSFFDISLVAFLFYQIMAMLKGTRAAQILVGMLVILSAYAISSFFQLETLNWIISKFYSSFIIFVIVVFQDDIRRILLRFGRSPFVTGIDEKSGLQVIDEVINAAKYMSHDRLGALIVFERGVSLERLHDHSTRLDAHVSEQLLICIFQSFSPLHDGAVVIQKNKIVCASAQLPLTKNPIMSKKLGTRHSAAVGISEDTDAVALIVSEETGSISIAWEGHIQRQLSADAAKRMLTSMLLPNYDREKEGYQPDEWFSATLQRIGFKIRRLIKKPTVYRGEERRQRPGDRRDFAIGDPRARIDDASHAKTEKGLELRFPSTAKTKRAKVEGKNFFVLGNSKKNEEMKESLESFEEEPFESDLADNVLNHLRVGASGVLNEDEIEDAYGSNEAARSLSHMGPEDKFEPPSIPMPPPQDVTIGGVSIEAPMDTVDDEKKKDDK